MLDPGSRISAYIPASSERVTGTIRGFYNNPRLGRMQWLMIPDKRSLSFEDFPEVGLGHSTVFVSTETGSENEVLELDPSLDSSWTGVPQQVGVYTTRNFSHDGVVFPIGTVGRVVRFLKYPLVGVMWNNPAIPSRAAERFRLWEVPTGYFSFGFVDLPGGKVISAWSGTAPSPSALKSNFKVGDVVTYVFAKPFPVTGRAARTRSMVRGTVLVVDGIDGAMTTATIIGNCQEQIIGVGVKIGSSALSLFPFTWIGEDKKVRVMEEVTFRKKSLRDQIGLVLSSTDQDGDVGVQFLEDIGAGSLDGLGQDGKCLFIPSKALEISE